MKRLAAAIVVPALTIIWVGSFVSAPVTPVSSAIIQGPSHRLSRHVGRHRLKNGTSTNWSGYAVVSNLSKPDSNAVSNVGGRWTVPTLSCAKNTPSSYSSNWVGIDGYSDNTVEQIGTEQDCNRANPVYYAWYEMYPQASVKVSLNVAAGNVVQASVAYANTSYTLTFTDQTTGKTYSTTKRLTSAERQSAEWVTEAPSSWSGILPLANFGTTNFTNATATLNGHTGTISDSAWQHDVIVMKTNANAVKAQPSALNTNGDSFSVAWQHN